MKSFVAIFAVCLVGCAVIMMILGGFVTNIWAGIVGAALLLAILISILLNMACKIEDLQEQVQKLQQERPNIPKE